MTTSYPAPTADAIAALMIADLLSADPDDLRASINFDDIAPYDSMIATTFDDMRDDFDAIFDSNDFYRASLDPAITNRIHDLALTALHSILHPHFDRDADPDDCPDCTDDSR